MKQSVHSLSVAVCMFLALTTVATSAEHSVPPFDPTPAAIDIDSARTAVLVVDMQNDFGAKGGLFDLMGLDMSGIQRVVAPTARVLASARQAGLKIVYLKMAFRPDLSDLGREGSPNRVGHLRAGVGKAVRAPDGSASRILIRDTWNTDILPALKPERGDVIIYKNRYSGFFETELDATLKKMGVTQLIVTGCTTSICVESTIRDAMFRDYSCVLLADCTAEPMGDGLARSNYEASLLLIQLRLGAVSNSATFVKAVEARGGTTKGR